MDSSMILIYFYFLIGSSPISVKDANGNLKKDGMPLDLPCLQDSPRVTDIKNTSVVVRFFPWDEGIDGGSSEYIPNGFYSVEIKKETWNDWITANCLRVYSSGETAAKVEDLEPCFNYSVRVLVETDLGKFDASLNYQRTTFRTQCPGKKNEYASDSISFVDTPSLVIFVILITLTFIVWKLRRSVPRHQGNEEASDIDLPSLPSKGLKDAVCEGDVEAVKQNLALRKDPHITWQHSRYHLSLLTAAALNGHIEVMKVLLEAGLTLQGPGKRYPTALHLAAFEGHSNVVKFILEEYDNQMARSYGNIGKTRCVPQQNHSSFIEALVYDGSTPLHNAANNGHIVTVRELSNAGANINAKNNNGSTPLHSAAYNGHLDTVTALIEARADIDAKDNNGVTPLHSSANSSHVDVIKILIEAGANTNAKDNDGSTSLHSAIRNGHLDAVKEIMKAPTDTNAKDNNGSTPLHFAADYGLVDAVTELLEGGANSKAKNNNGDTPLHFAACIGDISEVTKLIEEEEGNCVNAKNRIMLHSAPGNDHIKVMEKLLEAKADINAGNNNGITPLHFAAYIGHVNTVKMLLSARANTGVKSCNGSTPMHFAAANGYVGVVKEILEVGLTINAKKNNGMTSLHLATAKGCVDTVKELLDAGADITALDNNRTTPLHFAASKGHFCVVEELIEAKADSINAVDSNGATPSHLATDNNHVNVLKILLRAGANSNAKDNNGSTVLHSAAQNGLLDAVTVLLRVGAIAGAKDNNGTIPLHFAAGNGYVAVMRELKNNSSHINAKNNRGETPLHFAARNGYVDALKEMLITADCNTDVKDNDGTSPLHFAAGKGFVDILKVLLEAGANFSAKNNNGAMPLHLAARNGHVDAIEELSKTGASMSAQDNTGGMPLHFAAGNGKADAVKALIQAGANTNAKDNNGSAPLHFAAQNGHADVVRELLTTDDINTYYNNIGITPLHLAAQNGYDYVIEELLEAGADLDITDNNGRTPLHFAVANDHTDTVKLLVNAGANERAADNDNLTPLHNAFCGNNSEMKNFFLRDRDTDAFKTKRNCKENIPDPDAFKYIRNTWDEIENECKVIQDYSKSNETDTVVQSIRNGFDGHLQDINGMTALHWAAKEGRINLVRALIEDCGMYPLVMTYEGKTPADLAQEEGHSEIIKVLNTIPSSETEGSEESLYENLLDLFRLGDDVKQARNILWAGAPLTPVGRCSSEALKLAVDFNRPQILSLLMAAGAPLISTTTGGLSLLNTTFRNQEINVRIKVLILRACLHSLWYEYQYIKDNEEITAGIKQMFDLSGSLLNLDEIVQKLQTAEGYSKMIQAKWPSRNCTDLTSLLTEATRKNCPLLCSFLYHAGARSYLGRGDESPLIVAIENQLWKTLKAFVCNMRISPYVFNSKGYLPLRKLSSHLLHEMEQTSYEQERRNLESLLEAKKNYLEKLLVVDVLKLQEGIFECYRNHMHKDVLNKISKPSLLSTIQRLFAKLLKSKANKPLVASRNINTAGLLIAEQRGLPQLIFLLVQAGGNDVDTVVDTTMGTTSLHQAASHGKGQCVGLLLDLGADPFLPDRYGHTAMHLAAMYGHEDVYQLLHRHKGDKEYVCRANNTPKDVDEGFKQYLQSYKKCGQGSRTFQDISFCANPSDASAKLLNCLKWKMLLKEVNRITVDFSKGEAKVVRDTVMNELRIICDEVAKVSGTYRGELQLHGSASDGTKLYRPDEFDVNLEINGDSLNISIEAVREEGKDHKLALKVKSDKPDLQDNNLVNRFYDLVKKCLDTHILDDERLSLTPPGITRTQVGVALSMAWHGEEYPLLLIAVDLVPVVKVRRPKEVSQPQLTPYDMETIHICNTADGKWRCSFAGQEAAVLQTQRPEVLIVYLIGKILLSCMKPEPWMSRCKKKLYTWWDKREWKIPIPSTFALKNAFFTFLQEELPSNTEWHEEERLQRVTRVFRKMCRNSNFSLASLECLEHAQLRAYFGGDFEPAKSCVGAPEIVKYLCNLENKIDVDLSSQESYDSQE